MPAKPRVKDWAPIETLYRFGEGSVNAIAKEFGISHTAIHKRAKAHGWTRMSPKAVAEPEVSAEVSTATVETRTRPRPSHRPSTYRVEYAVQAKKLARLGAIGYEHTDVSPGEVGI